MQRQEFIRLLQKYPVAAAVKSEEEGEFALSSKVSLIFLLKGNAFHIAKYVERAHQLGKGLVVHVDLIGGVGKDRSGVQYLRKVGVDAIITSRAQLVAAGHAEGLVTIQRLLLLDNSALESGAKTIERAHPDLIEVLPGIIFPEVVSQLQRALHGPFIAGGFIRTAQDVERIRSAGAVLCSTSERTLWGTNGA
jgi:glycerol uptake operon antiterminator